MITHLEGELSDKSPARIVMNVAGVGYEVFIPLSSYDRLPAEGASIRILTHHHVREDAQVLYGFTSDDERRLFVLMLGVSGIGPKIALSVLSGLSGRELKAAVSEGDVKRLSSISGVGKKTAERLVIELRDKFTDGEVMEAMTGGKEPGPQDVRMRDAILALVSLGYKQQDAHKMISAIAPSLSPDDTVEDAVRIALTK